MRDNGDETYTPFSFQIVKQAPEPRYALMRPENENEL
jgi:hypothetical protein